MFKEYFKIFYRHFTRSPLNSIISILSLFIGIACMGLFGLASFNTKQKTKEIGIRKVLRASSVSILTRLGLQFTSWVFLANILAWPVAFYIISSFLKNYAYRISMPYAYFIITTLATLLLTWITIGYQSYRASITNPSDTLRHE